MKTKLLTTVDYKSRIKLLVFKILFLIFTLIKLSVFEFTLPSSSVVSLTNSSVVFSIVLLSAGISIFFTKKSIWLFGAS